MNAQAYKGIPPRQTPAQRHDRALRDRLGPVAYAEYRAERAAYYLDLIRQTRKAK